MQSQMNNGEKPNSPSLDSFFSWSSYGVPFSSRPFLHYASILTIVKIALPIAIAKLHLPHGAKKSTHLAKLTAESAAFKRNSCAYFV